MDGGQHPGSRVCSGSAIRGEARRRRGWDFSPAEQLAESSISASPYPDDSELANSTTTARGRRSGGLQQPEAWLSSRMIQLKV